MAGLAIVDETQRQQYEYELTEYLCYDVWRSDKWHKGSCETMRSLP
jgi:hypothetical protein